MCFRVIYNQGKYKKGEAEKMGLHNFFKKF